MRRLLLPSFAGRLLLHSRSLAGSAMPSKLHPHGSFSVYFYSCGADGLHGQWSRNGHYGRWTKPAQNGDPSTQSTLNPVAWVAGKRSLYVCICVCMWICDHVAGAAHSLIISSFSVHNIYAPEGRPEMEWRGRKITLTTHSRTCIFQHRKMQ